MFQLVNFAVVALTCKVALDVWYSRSTFSQDFDEKDGRKFPKKMGAGIIVRIKITSKEDATFLNCVKNSYTFATFIIQLVRVKSGRVDGCAVV